MKSPHEILADRLGAAIPADRLIQDPLRTLAYGTDASCYRLTPKLVVRAKSENEVAAVMRECRAMGIPYTFRAAGTSLSGQAVSDSVLIQLSRTWNSIDISPDGCFATFDPVVLGGAANAALAKYGRKIGPDPASIDSATIGGIVSNNSSGMCCGNVQDTYHTLKSMRIVLADGTSLDTASEASRRAFAERRGDLLRALEEMAVRVKNNQRLADRIRKKYRIKNTMGYNLHSLIDFSDGFDLLTHVIVGSEGTLAFVSQATYHTVPDPPLFATSLLLFKDIRAACEACFPLSEIGVATAELMDRASLRSVEYKPGMPEGIRTFGEDICGLLIEVRANTREVLDEEEQRVRKTLTQAALIRPPEFTRDKTQSKYLWQARKGLIPSIGGARAPGTTVIMEDVAVETRLLADACLDLRDLMGRVGYDDSVIFGHTLQGNVHFTICPDLSDATGIHRYEEMMVEVADIIAGRYDGSLKAEHGTGRNMAPFLEQEWGSEAVAIMREIKNLFDPEGLLNPGVILNSDPQAHLKNLKQMPLADALIDKCIECGFCERMCPSRHLTLTPRQRIVVSREIARLQATGEDAERLKALEDGFAYMGDETCATDGMCGTACPVEIDTGKFIKKGRAKKKSGFAKSVASALAKNMRFTAAAARLGLRTASAARSVLGASAIEGITKTLHDVAGAPQWNRWVPSAAPSSPVQSTKGEPVVYFPSCTSRIFGAPPEARDQRSQPAVFQELLAKAGYRVIIPEGVAGLCCGLAFSSKGFDEAGDAKRTELVEALNRASGEQKLPIVFDTSPCVQRMREVDPRVKDPVEFILEASNRLEFRKQPGTIAVHSPCSAKKMDLEARMIQLAGLCAEKVVVPDSVPCCGFAGDRGFAHPELTASALVSLKGAIPSDCREGYSSSRTCEIGLASQSGVPYQSILYLVNDAATGAKR